MFLTCVLYYSDARPSYRWWAFGIFLFAIFTDALDGLIARKLKLKTKLGTFLDPFADKLLLLSGFIGITSSKAFQIAPPLWAIVIIVFRDLLIVSGLLIIFLSTGHITIRPNKLGKLTTFFQMFAIAALLLESGFSRFVLWFTVILTILSGLAYTMRGIRLLNVKHSESSL